jgi:flagellar basal-body rod protein FlgC
MSLLSALDISTSGLTAERFRMEVVAQNIANIETTKTNGSGPYRRKMVVFKEVLGSEINKGKNASADFNGKGVEVSQVVADNAAPIMVYDPQNPDANQEGYVSKPNMNLADQIVDSITASRAYGANVTVLDTTKSMALKALTIGRG